MLNQIPEAIKKSSRLLTMRHPNSVDAKLFRKVLTRNHQEQLGGAMMLGAEDETDYDVIELGDAKMLFLGRIAGSQWAANGLDYVNDEDIAACIEPLDETAFKPQKNDRVFWIEAAFVKAFQIEQVISPLQMPSSHLAVYHLIPIEQPYDFTESTV
jgi:hypothetical protein